MAAMLFVADVFRWKQSFTDLSLKPTDDAKMRWPVSESDEKLFVRVGGIRGPIESDLADILLFFCRNSLKRLDMTSSGQTKRREVVFEWLVLREGLFAQGGKADEFLVLDLAPAGAAVGRVCEALERVDVVLGDELAPLSLERGVVG